MEASAQPAAPAPPRCGRTAAGPAPHRLPRGRDPKAAAQMLKAQPVRAAGGCPWCTGVPTAGGCSSRSARPPRRGRPEGAGRRRPQPTGWWCATASGSSDSSRSGRGSPSKPAPLTFVTDRLRVRAGEPVRAVPPSASRTCRSCRRRGWAATRSRSTSVPWGRSATAASTRSFDAMLLERRAALGAS